MVALAACSAVYRELHEMTLLPICDHPTKLTLRLDQFSG